MTVPPFKLLNEPELARIQALVEQAVAGWRQDWLAEESEIAVRAMPAAELALESGKLSTPLVRTLDESRWIAALAGSGAYCAMAALAAGQTGQTDGPVRPMTPLLQGAIEECFAALCDAVLAPIAGGKPHVKTPESGFSVDDAWRRGSGAAVALLSAEGGQCALLLSSRLVREMLGPQKRSARGGLVSRNESIQGQRLALQVMAGEAELNVGSLGSISPGDVILLDTGSTDLFSLTSLRGDLIGKGHLGALEGRKALQLTS